MFLSTGPQRPHASRRRALVSARCQRSEYMPHPLHAPVQRPAAANGMCRPGGKLCAGCRVVHVRALTGWCACAIGPEWGVRSTRSRHTVCHLGGGGLCGTACWSAGVWSGWGVYSERWQRARM